MEALKNMSQNSKDIRKIKNKRKKSLALKASTSFDDDEDELDENKSKEEDDEMAFLSKKLQRILSEKRRTIPQRRNQNKNE